VKQAPLFVLLVVASGCDPATPAGPPPPHVSTAPGALPPIQEPKGTDEPVEAMRAKWNFKEGSWVELRITVQRQRGTETKKETYNKKYTVQKITGTHVTMLVQEQGGRQKESEVPLAPTMKKIGTETIDADGKAYDCTIYWKVEKDREEGEQIIQMWVCKDAPGKIVRHDQTTRVAGQEIKGTGGLKKLGQRMTLASKTITYATWEFSGKATTGGEVTISQWVSDQVPGLMVKEEKRLKLKDSEDLRITELVDFEVK
jgi:hypothetical protein